MTELTAQDIIDRLDLSPHPEGGHYRQTWIDNNASGRASGTCIYFLLTENESSHWHKVDSTEIWHFYAGTPVTLLLSETDQGPATAHVLGPDLVRGQRPQIIVPTYHWQAAKCSDAWSLVGCTVSPGFDFSGFHLADPNFDIPLA